MGRRPSPRSIPPRPPPQKSMWQLPNWPRTSVLGSSEFSLRFSAARVCSTSPAERQVLVRMIGMDALPI